MARTERGGVATRFNSETASLAAKKRWDNYVPTEKPKKSHGGMIYLIQSGTKVKIGVARSLSQRLTNLQIGNPDALEVIMAAYSKVPYAIEKALHEHFMERRVRGEWYDITREEAMQALMEFYIYD